MTYDCPDGKVTTKFGYDTYTEEEIDILQSDEHCLDYLYNYRTFSSKQECYDSLLLPSSINLGLTCGYYKYSIKYSLCLNKCRCICRSIKVFLELIINLKKCD